MFKEWRSIIYKKSITHNRDVKWKMRPIWYFQKIRLGNDVSTRRDDTGSLSAASNKWSPLSCQFSSNVKPFPLLPVDTLSYYHTSDKAKVWPFTPLLYLAQSMSRTHAIYALRRIGNNCDANFYCYYSAACVKYPCLLQKVRADGQIPVE